MIKTKYKILIITITFILIMFFPKVANAKYLNVSTPSSGQPGSTVSVTVSTDCTGRFNVSVSNGTLNGTNKYWIEASSASFSVTLGQSGTTKISVTPALPVSLNKQDINDLGGQTKSISINSSNSNSNNQNSNNSNNNGSTLNNGSSNNSSKTVKMITTSPVNFSGFTASKKGPYRVTVGKDVQQLKILVKYTDGTTNTYTKNLESGQRSYSFDGYKIIVTKNSEESEVIPNEIDDEETTDKEDEQKQKLRLDNLVLDDNLNAKLDPNFDSEVFEYTVILGNDYLDLKELYINALPNIDGAKVTIEGNKELTDGETTVTIKVEAEGYETVTYTIKVVKQEIVETEAEPVLEETDDVLDNSKELMKKRRIICSLVCLITIIGIIFIAKECYESTNNLEENYYDEDDEYDEEYINSKYEYPEENNILEDLYKIKNNDTETHNTPFLREEQNNIENNNNEKIENTETKMDEFFSKNTRIEFSEGRTRRKHKKGKHS